MVRLIVLVGLLLAFFLFRFVVLDPMEHFTFVRFRFVLDRCHRFRFVPFVEQLILIEIVEIIGRTFRPRIEIFFFADFHTLDTPVLIVFHEKTL